MFSLSSSGDFKHCFDFFKRMGDQGKTYSILQKCGQEGVRLLSESTPLRTGRTASSWDYEIEETGGGYTITWTNSNINRNVNIAVILQYGHGTGTGGYVQGIDYINPAMQQAFQDMVNRIWEEVTRV